MMRVLGYSDDWAHTLSIIIRYAEGNRPAKGFMLKWLRKPNGLMFSEREGCYRHAWKIGKLYIRTFARKPAVIGRER